jgi:hypothetical protein
MDMLIEISSVFIFHAGRAARLNLHLISAVGLVS